MKHKNCLVVFGAGGHGKVVADMAMESGWHVDGFVDDDPTTARRTDLQFPVLGDSRWLLASAPGAFCCVVAVGDNRMRSVITRSLRLAKVEIVSIVSGFAKVSRSARIGVGTVVMPGAIINAAARLGEGVIVNSGSVVEHDVYLGDYTHVSPNATLGGAVYVGDFTHIGLGATVLPGIRVGQRSIVGAGSVAARALPDDVVAFGVPAQVRRSLYEHSEPAIATLNGGQR